MALDPVKNFAISRVATAPSPAASGTTLVVETGDGVLFPDPSSSGEYNVVIYPNGEQPTSSNAEIVRVTARSTDTMTITREQESSSARTIVEGDVVMLGITAKVIDDMDTVLEAAVTQTSTDTLTNKTIDGDDNTLQDIGDSSLKTPFKVKIGSFNISTSSGTNQSVSGVGFQPKFLHFYIAWSDRNDRASYSEGFYDGTSQFAIASTIMASGGNGFRRFSSTQALKSLDSGDGSDYSAFTAVSMDSDGFTINPDTANGGLCYYIAYG